IVAASRPHGYHSRNGRQRNTTASISGKRKVDGGLGRGRCRARPKQNGSGNADLHLFFSLSHAVTTRCERGSGQTAIFSPLRQRSLGASPVTPLFSPIRNGDLAASVPTKELCAPISTFSNWRPTACRPLPPKRQPPDPTPRRRSSRSWNSSPAPPTRPR